MQITPPPPLIDSDLFPFDTDQDMSDGDDELFPRPKSFDATVSSTEAYRFPTADEFVLQLAPMAPGPGTMGDGYGNWNQE